MGFLIKIANSNRSFPSVVIGIVQAQFLAPLLGSGIFGYFPKECLGTIGVELFVGIEVAVTGDGS